jgi:hypothetical protein
MAETVTVEVVYATTPEPFLRRVQVPTGSTVAAAVEASGIADAVPGFRLDPERLGIFSRKVGPQEPVGEGDRIEIYRPLALDPKEARRRRAQR